MNKQELIEKYKSALNKVHKVYGDYYKTEAYEEVLKDLKQLDESQKVTVPQFVADYIKDAKYYEWDLDDVFDHIAEESEESEIYKWFYVLGNVDIFARAWLDGYEVEKEKRYLVKVKGVNDYGCYLNKGLLSKEYFWESKAEIGGCRTKHTRKQLEDDGFGWVFDCPGIEIEEVE